MLLNEIFLDYRWEIQRIQGKTDLVKRKYRRRFSINEGVDNRYYLSRFFSEPLSGETRRVKDIGKYNSLKEASRAAFHHYIIPLKDRLRDFNLYLNKITSFTPLRYEEDDRGETIWRMGVDEILYIVKQGAYPSIRDITHPEVYARKIKLRRKEVAKKRQK